MKTLYALALVGLVALGPVGRARGAPVRDGTYLLKQCGELVRPSLTHDTLTQGGWCAGYLESLSDTTLSEGHCFPEGITTGQVARIVVRYLETHPATLPAPAWALAMEAVHEAFPCPPATAPPHR